MGKKKDNKNNDYEPDLESSSNSLNLSNKILQHYAKEENHIKNIILPIIIDYLDINMTEDVLFNHFTQNKTCIKPVEIFNIIGLDTIDNFDNAGIYMGGKYLPINDHYVSELKIKKNIFQKKHINNDVPFIFELIETYLEKKAKQYGFKLITTSTTLQFKY